MEQYDFSLVIPVYNGEKFLDDTFSVLNQLLADPDRNFEIVLVDDGSADDSANMLKRYSADRKRVKIIILSENQGIFGAMREGFMAATCDIIASTEMTIEHLPQEIFRMVDMMDDNIDMVFSIRINRITQSHRLIGSALANYMVRRLAGLKVKDMNTLLLVWRREAGMLITEKASYGRMLHALRGMRLIETPVKFDRLPKHRSTFSFTRLAKAFSELTVTSIKIRLGLE